MRNAEGTAAHRAAECQTADLTQQLARSEFGPRGQGHGRLLSSPCPAATVGSPRCPATRRRGSPADPPQAGAEGDASPPGRPASIVAPRRPSQPAPRRGRSPGDAPGRPRPLPGTPPQQRGRPGGGQRRLRGWARGGRSGGPRRPPPPPPPAPGVQPAPRLSPRPPSRCGSTSTPPAS